jgi:hypothetical protein
MGTSPLFAKDNEREAKRKEGVKKKNRRSEERKKRKVFVLVLFCFGLLFVFKIKILRNPFLVW